MDSVFCELVYRWFCPRSGVVLDPIADKATSGIIASALDRQFFGVSSTSELAAGNCEQWQAVSSSPMVSRKWKISAAWASKPHDCTLEGILKRCGGGCCKSPTYWPPNSNKGVCAHLGVNGCVLSAEDKPVTCLLYPLVVNDSGTIVLHHRTTTQTGICKGNHSKGPALIDALEGNLSELFGEEAYSRLRREVMAGRDTFVSVPDDVWAAFEKEKEWAQDKTIPLARLSGGVKQSTDQPQPVWVVAQDNQLPEGIEFDLVFTALSVERSCEKDEYEKFLAGCVEKLKEALGCLRDDRFVCIVVEDGRGDDDCLFGLSWDIVGACRAEGLRLHNDAVLVKDTSSPSASVNLQFRDKRMLWQGHQNVLVFVKGDVRRAAEACGPVEAYSGKK